MATGGGSASRLGMMIVGAYLVAVNVGAAGLFYYDKQCAIRHQWRVRESTLQLSALAGGNPPAPNHLLVLPALFIAISKD